MMTMQEEEMMREGLQIFQREVHRLAKEKGFYEAASTLPRYVNVVMRLALIHDEVSEALREMRTATETVSEENGQVMLLGGELADIIIRTLDLAAYLNIDLPTVMLAKHKANKTRPPKHGKKF